VGPREKLCMGVISMVAVLLVSVFGVWYAKRRFG
jgi:(2Fe-2S) ferredoxin